MKYSFDPVVIIPERRKWKVIRSGEINVSLNSSNWFQQQHVGENNIHYMPSHFKRTCNIASII